ncbi:MAG: DNA-3-methyladenine glycosylase 2 family protein [Labilithrix sp.]|nr:DNA-3-methyladenine glycosylase 2 family protein [Labilithrix sp.]MCW5812168.1 DNA-3-methyladenine glycosylase 2 family protein [Labilithrix sp.]
MQTLDAGRCYRALLARDARFDGRFFVAVRTTGIYCRPICPARTPKRENVTFFASAAAAQEAGYRPCLRCRPESSPQLAAWRGTSSTVSRAMMLIAEGALDGAENGVESLAQRLGIGGCQLRRLFQEHVGTSPIAVAQTRRLLFAKKLVHETSMPMAEIAHAAGYGSLRRFNDAFHQLYGRPPSALRGRRAPASALTLSLSYVPPYDWDEMQRFFAARAIPGVEVVTPRVYTRTIEEGGACGTIAVAPSPKKDALAVTICFPAVAALPAIIARVRRMFDLDADVRVIHAALSKDPLLRPLVAARPGLRVPGGWDPFEVAVRAILGQQVSVVAARGLAGRLVARYGRSLEGASAGGLTHLFPRPEALARAGAETLGMPRARVAALAACARAVAADPGLLSPARSLDDAGADLRALPGVGEWTAQYVALRALRDPDAFPASDLGLLRGAATSGARPTPAALLARAEAWRPWRAYAAQHLWCADAGEKRLPLSA